ncbi:MAG: hypothetical protein M3209_12370 [Acidobacteriota bacterium]|nr:hypothetical protein [Acidobacteriota bacterium]
MTNKLHNRTLFVAALSVYFGLLIVGAPPQVLAQTSKTINNAERVFVPQKDFQSLNFINKKGDSSGRSLAEAFEQFFKGVENDAVLKSLLSKTDFELRSTASRGYYVEDSPPPISLLVDSRNLEKLDEAQITAVVRNSFHFNLAEYTDQLILISVNEVDFRITQDEIVLKTSTIWGKENRHNVAGFADSLRSLYEREANSASAIERLIYSNTEVSVSKDQIFVVTRLPRAALDSLVQADEKAN